MARKKRDSKKGMRDPLEGLAAHEILELENIVERLRLQDPHGESLEAYLESLHEVLENRHTLVAALVDRLSRQQGEVSFLAFTRLKKLLPPKQFKRLIKQAEYRFRQRGFEIHGNSENKPEKIVIVQAVEAPSKAHSLWVGPGLQMVAILGQGRNRRNPVLVSFIFDLHRRIEESKFEQSSSSGYRKFLKWATQTSGARSYEIPPWHAALLFFESLKQHPNQESASMTEAINLLKSLHEVDRKPYAYELFAHVSAIDQRVIREKTDEVLLRSGLVEAMPDVVSKENLEPFFRKLLDLEQSVLIVSQDVKIQRIDAILRQATDEIFDHRAIFFQKRYLEEQAVHYKLAGDSDLAQAIWMISQHLDAIEEASESYYLMRLLGVALHYYWGEEIRRMLAPGQESSSLRRASSGLILPNQSGFYHEA